MPTLCIKVVERLPTGCYARPNLTPQEYKVVKLGYGLENSKAYTLEEVALILNLPERTVEDLQEGVLRKIMAAARKL